MEFSLFLVYPLPSWTPWTEAIEFEVNVLVWTALLCAFISVGNTAKIDDLLLAYFLYFELQNLVNTRALLTSICNLTLPQVHTVKFKVILVCFLEFLDGRMELVLKLKEDVLSETFAEHSECL